MVNSDDKFHVGDKVSHNMFGIGQVVGIRNHGHDIEVQFKGLSRLILDTYLKNVTIRQTNLPRQGVSAGKSLPNKVDSVLSSIPKPSPRSMIEAFRLGVVPYGAVKEFTFGRDREIGIIKNWLNNNSEGSLIIRSGYGSGKSHFLDYINEFAIENNYADCSAEFDQETPPYRPHLIYGQFIKSFKLNINNNILSFRDFVKEIAAKSDGNYSIDGYLGRIIHAIKMGYGYQDPLEWIEGRRKGRYYGLGFFDNGTASNIYCHLIAEIAAKVSELPGKKGLVVTIDEAERVTDATKVQLLRGWHFVRGLTMLSANDTRLQNEVINRELQPDGSWFGSETKLVYSGHETNLRYCDNLPSFVKVVFAFTDQRYEMEDWLTKWAINHIPMKLDVLSEADLKEIFDNIYKLYSLSYDFYLSNSTVLRAYDRVTAKTHGSVTRYFIKASVEILDILRYYPSLSPESIE